MKKYKIYILGLISLLFTFNSYAQYTLQDSDVKMFYGFITELTEQGENNVKDTSIIVPQQLQGQNIIGIGRDVFSEKGLKGIVQLPSTIEYIGDNSFRENENMTYPNFKELTNLKIIGNSSFYNVSNKYSDKLDFSNLTKLEKIGCWAFALNGIDSIKELDFSNCTSLKSIGGMAFVRPIGINQFDKINFSNCRNLSFIGFANFAFEHNTTDTIEAIMTQVNFSNCKSLICLYPWVLGLSKQQMESLIPILSTPEINGVTFSKWVIDNYNDNTTIRYGLLATFKEKVISVKKVGEGGFSWGSKSKSQTYQELLTAINQQKNAKDSKQVQFEITNHSINNVEISNILCTTQSCTLDWTNGTIETGKTQTVTVTYPEGTEYYTATITIEGENLMGNTTVNVGETGGVTTDDNLLSGVAQQNIQDGNLFKLSPNPTNNFINIQLNDFNTQSPTDIEIYNMQGKLMYKNKITERETKIDITDFTPDNYLVVIKKDDKYEVKQIIKH